MDKLPQKLPRKCKLELRQPYIKCGGREDVTCTYRGKIVSEFKDDYIIEFKYKGIKRRVTYNKVNGFPLAELQDIKLKE